MSGGNKRNITFGACDGTEFNNFVFLWHHLIESTSEKRIWNFQRLWGSSASNRINKCSGKIGSSEAFISLCLRWKPYYFKNRNLPIKVEEIRNVVKKE